MEYKTEDYDSTYVFSAEQQEKVKRIQQKYLPQGDKMERLLILDKSVTRPGTIAAVVACIVGAVIHGAGCALISEELFFIPGTMIAVLGLLVLFSAYPIYRLIIKQQRERLAPQILDLCQELLK